MVCMCVYIYTHIHTIYVWWYIYTIEYYLAIQRDTFVSVLMRWMNLESIIQSEISQKEKYKWQPIPAFLPRESQGRWGLVAAVYGVARSRTRLKRLSSSSSSGAYIWTLERWYWWINFQGSNGETNSRPIDTGREEGMVICIEIWKFTIPYVK